jgi:pimeloyl-ACP methyl ester carboxylesterase
MVQFKQFSALGPHGFHRVAYTEWGEADNPNVVICAHGVTRNGRDFDFLARGLEKDFRVICPDVTGRGQSEWLTHKEDYSYPLYVADMAALIARANVGSVSWVGTSMGGLIGMFIASQPNTPIKRLLLNDMGAFIPKSSLERIGAYVGADPAFDSVEELEQTMRVISAPFGPLTDAQWRHLAEHMAMKKADGKIHFNYDPDISLAFKQPQNDISLWPIWNNVTCPVLITRGVNSDLLLPDTVEKMKQGRANVQSAEIADTGHAPMLMDEAQIHLVREFLLAA